MIFDALDVGKIGLNNMKYLLITIFSFAIFLVALATHAKTPTVFSVKILDKNYTKTEYINLKSNLVSKVRGMKSSPISWSEANLWIALARVELKDCQLTLKAGDDIITVINEKLSTGC